MSRRARSLTAAFSLVFLLLATPRAHGGDLDEFKIKRQQVFEFTREPEVTRKGDRIEIRFASKGYCDVTVAVEDPDARVLRHLACGVLGRNAPAPFQKNSLAQTLVWDGKDDQGKYIDDKDALMVRVSLGLKPRFERTLFWFPKRRSSRFPPLMAAAPDGVYVFDGGSSLDFLRLYSHDGDYVRTVYPFPADKVGHTKGLLWHTFPQDGKRLPVKSNFTQMTMLTSGTNSYKVLTYRPDLKAYRSVVANAFNAHYGMEGGAGSAMAVNNGRIALVHIFLNRLATDGTTGGLELTGPKVVLPLKKRRRRTVEVPPRSAALGPDGKTLYYTGFVFAHLIGKASADIITNSNWDAFQAVMRLDVETGTEPKVFVGSTKLGENGSDNAHFNLPTSVATDRKGRVYVSDYLNDRVQVFTPEGKWLKSIKTPRPAKVAVHQRTGEVYVFSWTVMTVYSKGFSRKRSRPTLTRFGPLPAAKKLAAHDLSTQGLPSRFNPRYGTTFFEYFAELDSWAADPTFWIVQEWSKDNVITRRDKNYSNIVLLRIKDGKLNVLRDFGKELKRTGVRGRLHVYHRQRMYVNPKTGRLYLTEGGMFSTKSFKEAWVIDPATGKFKVEQLPFDAEDMCFDLDGLAYLRTIPLVARYDAAAWREVPWDYGEEQKKVSTNTWRTRRTADVASALRLPANGGWHHAGMYVSAKGHLVVGCNYIPKFASRKDDANAAVGGGKAWAPRVYPGRSVAGRGGGVFLHVWDKHGQLVHEDIVPGLADNAYGLGLDSDDNVYLLAAATRVLDGALYFNDMTGTMMKFRPGRGKVYSTLKKAPVTLPQGAYRKRPFDLENAGQGKAWVEGGEWMYGGVGWCGKNRGTGCACFNTRFAFDYFARSFAPEMDRYSVAVLDTNGNLIVRVGKYGNADDGAPLIPHPGIRKARSVGGDEVALFHGAYLATHTDRRLFIADQGNGRVLGVRLGYHASQSVPLKDVPDKVDGD